jgi:hypothetical protein
MMVIVGVVQEGGGLVVENVGDVVVGHFQTL